MALFDDRRFLLSHINHSFITGDDTGICEVVMLDEDVFKNQHKQCLKLDGQDEENLETRLDPEAYDLDYESELFESEQGQSYDIASDLDYICHRRRSNTAQRLDRLKKEKINQSRTKTIVWRCNSPTGSQNEDRLSQDSPTSTNNHNDPTTSNKFENGFLENRKSKSPPGKSGLTRLLERFPSLPKNPFDEFAQFDGGMSETVPVKKIMIYIALESQTQSNANKPKNDGPLEVVIVSTARVQDLIGLICWQYTNEGREPKLHHDISRYCLRIVEDNGDVDADFTSLNPKEPLLKFNFPSLALTIKTTEPVKTDNNTEIDNDQQTILNSHNQPVFIGRVPTIASNTITNSSKLSGAGSRLAALTKIIFKDAKLNTSNHQNHN